MAEIEVPLYGYRPSFRPADGPLTAIVGLDGAEGDCLIDPERARCRVEAIGGPDLLKWQSPAGLLMAARAGWWGLRVVEDHLPDPAIEIPAPTPPPPRKGIRLPADLASCPRCGAIVVLAREKGGPGFGLVTPSRRLFRSIRRLFEADGLDFAPECRGRGDRAGRDHGRDCLSLEPFRPWTQQPKKRRRGRPRAEPKPYVPLPWKVAKEAVPCPRKP